LTNGDTTFQIGADSFANLSTSVIPNTGEAYQTVAGNVSGLAYKTAFDMGAGDGPARKNAIGYALAQKVAGGSLSVRYVGNTDQDNASSAGDVGRDGGSSTRVIYSGSLGVEGLNVMAGWAEDEATGSKTQKGKAKTFGAAYNFGQITVGAQRKNYEPLDTAVAQDEYKVNEFGIGFAASDNLTLSVVHITTDGDSNGTDFANKEKITGVGIGYNLGGIAVELSYADVQDAGGASGWIHFTGSTAGFLWAFLIAALVVGALAERVRRFRYGSAAMLMLLGHAILLALGLAWQRGIVPAEASWTDPVMALMPAVLVKSALGTLVVVIVGRLLDRHSLSRDGAD